MKNDILSEVKKPLTPDEFEKELVRLANIMNSPIPAGANITENSKQKDARAIYITRCHDADRIHAAIDKSINKLSKEHNWLIALIEALEAERRWIPMEERLPETETLVLVGDIKDNRAIAYIRQSDGKWYYDLYDEEGGKVECDWNYTHWQPLPSPPDRAQEAKPIFT